MRTCSIGRSSISILISIIRFWIPSDSPFIVWDIQTGSVILKVDAPNHGTVIFHGNQRIITLVLMNGHTHTYNMLDGMQLHLGDITLSLSPVSFTHWTHESSIWFAVSLKTDAKHVITIKKFQPTATPPLHTLTSFSIPPYDGEFSFSSVSFHASLSPCKRLLYLMFGTQKSYCRPKQLDGIIRHQGSSLQVGASLHVEHQRVRSVFGRVHLLVIFPGVISEPGFHFVSCCFHQLQLQSCVVVGEESNCYIQAIIPPPYPLLVLTFYIKIQNIWWHILQM